ncbi:MAG: hypothetical protein DRJ64_08825 [Thermoprotei archaeon]|nr:MAG: hypothetical protein DRJ64_08825 [Thermoprotei archaeon]
MLQTRENVNTEDLYKALVQNNPGTQIFIADTGEIETMEAGTWNKGEARLFFGAAPGDWSDDDWGISYHSDDDTGESWYSVESLDGKWDNRGEAFEAAVDAFGITAETNDELQTMIVVRIETEREAVAQRPAY